MLGILCHGTYGLSLAHIVEFCHERRVEVFGEEDEIALVVAHRIDEELYLLEEVVERVVGSHLPLYQSDTHRRALVDIRIRRWLIVDVVPLEQCGAMLRLLVVGQIVAHDTAHVEVVAQLERQHRVVYLA